MCNSYPTYDTDPHSIDRPLVDYKTILSAVNCAESMRGFIDIHILLIFTILNDPSIYDITQHVSIDGDSFLCVHILHPNLFSKLYITLNLIINLVNATTPET